MNIKGSSVSGSLPSPVVYIPSRLQLDSRPHHLPGQLLLTIKSQFKVISLGKRLLIVPIPRETSIVFVFPVPHGAYQHRIYSFVKFLL